MERRRPSRVVLVTTANKVGLAESCARAFEALGVTTRIFYSGLCNTWFDRAVIHPVNHYAHTLRLVPKTVNLFQGHPKSHKEYRSRQLLLLCQDFKPDLVLLIRGLNITPEVLGQLREQTTLFGWFVEGENRLGEIAGEAHVYHRLYFISSKALEWGKAQGLGHVSLMQHAVDTSRFRPLGVPKTYDWCFLGGWSRRRQEYLAGLIEVSGHCVIYGSKWRRRAWRVPGLWLRVRGEGLWGDGVKRLYNECRVVINVSAWGDEKQGAVGVNMRLLEVPASGACLLSDYAKDAERLMVPGEHFVSARTGSDMRDKLAGLLADDSNRERIAKQGCDRARSVRDYSATARQICEDWERSCG